MKEPISPLTWCWPRNSQFARYNSDYVCDLSDSKFTLDTSYATKQFKHLNHVLNYFWRRWRTEYLREGNTHILKRGPGNSNSQISIGEIVIVKDEHLPHGLWKLGIVQEVMKGQDGLKRAAVVKIASHDRQHTMLKRPIQLLKSTARQPPPPLLRDLSILNPVNPYLQKMMWLSKSVQGELPQGMLMKRVDCWTIDW